MSDDVKMPLPIIRRRTEDGVELFERPIQLNKADQNLVMKSNLATKTFCFMFWEEPFADVVFTPAIAFGWLATESETKARAGFARFAIDNHLRIVRDGSFIVEGKAAKWAKGTAQVLAADAKEWLEDRIPGATEGLEVIASATLPDLARKVGRTAVLMRRMKSTPRPN